MDADSILAQSFGNLSIHRKPRFKMITTTVGVPKPPPMPEPPAPAPAPAPAPVKETKPRAMKKFSKSDEDWLYDHKISIQSDAKYIPTLPITLYVKDYSPYSSTPHPDELFGDYNQYSTKDTRFYGKTASNIQFKSLEDAVIWVKALRKSQNSKEGRRWWTDTSKEIQKTLSEKNGEDTTPLPPKPKDTPRVSAPPVTKKYTGYGPTDRGAPVEPYFPDRPSVSYD